MNRALLNGFERHLLELRTALDTNIVAEMWDRGWTKVYEAYPSTALTKEDQEFAAKRLAAIIHTAQPIYEHIRKQEVK